MVTLNSFSGNRVQGPHSLLVFRPEFAQKKAGAPHGPPGAAGRIPMQLVPPGYRQLGFRTQ